MKKFLLFLFGILCGAAAMLFALVPAGKIVEHIPYVKAEPKDEVVIEETTIEEEAPVVEDTAMEEVPEFEEDVVESADQETAPTEEKKEEVLPVKIDTEHGRNGVAAIVNGKEVTVDEIRYTYDVNPQIKSKIPFEEFYGKALQIYVDGKLLYDSAVASNILDSEEYVKQAELMQQDIARKVS